MQDKMSFIRSLQAGDTALLIVPSRYGKFYRTVKTIVKQPIGDDGKVSLSYAVRNKLGETKLRTVRAGWNVVQRYVEAEVR